MNWFSANDCTHAMSAPVKPLPTRPLRTLLRSHPPPLWNNAVGLPHLLGLGVLLPLVMSFGIPLSLRDQNHTLIVLLVRSVAHQPPPFLLNDEPKSRVESPATPHPTLPFAAALQSSVRGLP